MSSEFSYAAALDELSRILATLQSDNCDIDSMVKLTGRAAELISQCRERLTATDRELRQVLERLQSSAPDAVE